MPKGTKVERCYQDLKKEGRSEGSAAAICQASTGLSLKTGRKPKKGMKDLRAKYRRS